jgi:hypothetical protein
MSTELASTERYGQMGKIEIYKANHLLRYVLPYIIRQTSDGSYVFLNREYKPIGWVPHWGDWADYDRTGPRFKIRGLTPEIAAKISVRGSPRTEWITLYLDDCRPQDGAKELRDYLKRLKLLYDLVEIENCGPSVPH